MERPFIERVNRFLERARARSQRRKSPWNSVLFLLAFGCWFAGWYLLFQLVWAFHVWIYPTHQFHDFWGRGINIVSFVLSFLMLFALMPCALLLGFLVANCVLWMVPPARRAFRKESEGFPEDGFRESNLGLLRLGKWVFPLGLAVSFLAASLLRSLR